LIEHDGELGARAPTGAQSHWCTAQPLEPLVMATQGAHATSAWQSA
jgi:hypothetical protein